MRKINIVLFSSGISEKNGILNDVMDELKSRGYNCYYWRNLFSNANDQNHIALLPMLIKKIPTFDFAILIGEGHDKTLMLRNGIENPVNTMRDNVIFEIGLCVMALGLSKTILLTDSHVHLPEDLTGVHNSTALKHIIYSPKNEESYKAASIAAANHIDKISSIGNEIDAYIKSNHKFSPVVVGAATSTACGYAENFILRTFEHILDGVIIESISKNKILLFDKDKIFMHIMIPETCEDKTNNIFNGLPKNCMTGYVPTARYRKAEFKCVVKNGELHIFDHPTTITTSYNIAKMILEIDADDSDDIFANERFSAKELDLFEVSLKAILNKDFTSQVIERYYKEYTFEQKSQLVNNILFFLNHRLSIERI